MQNEAARRAPDAARVEHEAERKYEVPRGAALDAAPIDGFTAGEPRTEHLVAEYFDTPDLAVLGSRCVLRRRTGGGDDGWHVKTPGDGSVRVELHAPLGASHRVPEALRAELAEAVGERPLLPVVTIASERTTTPLSDASGAAVALLCDDRVRARVMRRGADRELEWREIEVELAGDAPLETLDAIEPSLVSRGLEPSRHLSKLSRVLEGVEPEREPTADDPAGDAVVASMATHFGRLQALEAAVRRDEPDAVYQARIATRRLRSLLKVYTRLFETQPGRRLRDELKWAAGLLGGPRDAEVLRELVEAELVELAADGSAGGSMGDVEASASAGDVEAARRFARTELDGRHDAAFAELLEAMDSPRWDDLHAAIAAFVLDPPFRGAARRPAGQKLDALAQAAAATVAARVDEAEAAGTAAGGDDLPAWHEVRKSAKAARYAYETLAALEGGHAKKRRKAWKAVTKPLGELQDAVMLEHEFAALARVADDAATIAALEAALERIRARMHERLGEARELLDEM